MYIFFSCLHFVPDTSSFSGLPQSAKTVVSTEPPLLQVPGLKLLMPLHRAHARFYALEKVRRKRKEGGGSRLGSRISARRWKKMPVHLNDTAKRRAKRITCRINPQPLQRTVQRLTAADKIYF